MDSTETIAAINSGSSSLKFKLFARTDPSRQLARGTITGIGSAGSEFMVTKGSDPEIYSTEIGLSSIEQASEFLISWLREQPDYHITGMGHRVVHGGLLFTDPELITPDLLSSLNKLELMSPLHLPPAIALMRLFLRAFPDIPQLACFDTFFHRDMPFEAKYFALPRSLWEKGIVRYGFHGLSCQYIMEYLGREMPSINEKKIIIAHLGSGCSLTAVRNGGSIDTSMGFTPAGGMMMSSRSGDLDPGIISFLLNQEKMDMSGLDRLFNMQSGLNAISGTEDPMEELLKRRKIDPAAAQAVNMFCYQAKKQIGALATVLGGIDILVFTGGIGENEPGIRALICERLDFIGIGIDQKANDQSVTKLEKGKVAVRMIHTNEEIIMARQVSGFLQAQEQNKLYESFN